MDDNLGVSKLASKELVLQRSHDASVVSYDAIVVRNRGFRRRFYCVQRME